MQLVVNNPFQGIWVEGGAGSGKSASLIEKFHHDSIQKGFSGFIYDFKGNPPTLGHTAYNYWLGSKKTQKFRCLNFSVPWISCKANPIEPKNISNDLFIKEYADALMKNLSPETIQKPDFWSRSATSYVQGVIMWLKIYHPELCDLPHAIQMLSTDYEVVLEALITDENIQPHIQSIITAHEKNAEGQLSGVIGSAQGPMSALYNKELFWALSPTKEDYDADNVVDFDLSKKTDPTLLVVCNDPTMQIALSPVISIIASVVMKNINKKGNNPSIFSMDELPTIYIKNLEQLPATARSNKVVTLLSVQDYSQLEMLYGKDQAKTIISNMGNQMTGMTNNETTAKRVSEMLGKIKKIDLSYSTSKGSTSTSERRQLENVREIRDITGQNPGHFTGKIAGGIPPYFSGQIGNFEEIWKKKPNFNDESLPIIYPKDWCFEKNGDISLLSSFYEEKMNVNLMRIQNNIANALQNFKAIVDAKRSQ